MRRVPAVSGIALALILASGTAYGSSCDSGGSSTSGCGTVDAGLVVQMKSDDLLKQGRCGDAASGYPAG